MSSAHFFSKVELINDELFFCIELQKHWHYQGQLIQQLEGRIFLLYEIEVADSSYSSNIFFEEKYTEGGWGLDQSILKVPSVGIKP